MIKPFRIFCAGLIGWDNVGRTDIQMRAGHDLPGKIDTNIGGVAANIAVAIASTTDSTHELEIFLLSSTGKDDKSEALLSILSKHHGINCDYVIKQEGTCDGYICIEANGDLFGAVVSSAQLEKSCVKIFEPLIEKQKKEKRILFSDILIVDSNLTSQTIDYLIHEPFFDKTIFVIACASPYKAKKMRSLILKRLCYVYANLDEASSILGSKSSNSTEAANRLFDLGATEATVTNGKMEASNRSSSGLATILPKRTVNVKTTGAGDAFLAAHLLSSICNQELTQIEHLKIAEFAARKEISPSVKG